MRCLLKILRRAFVPGACLTVPAGSWVVARGGLLLVAIGLLSVQAYPPAPHHLLFGLVRDEFGHPLGTQNGEVILETLTGVRLKTTIVPGLRAGVNYQIEVPMDAGLTPDRYQPTALQPTLGFRLRVRIGSTDYLPIEMRADYSKLGQPAGRTRIDLTLGEDSDGDGLPDAWERALVAASGGRLTGLDDVRPGDDFDGDGLGNLAEYVAGTYAFDPQDGFTLSLVSAAGGAATLDFLAIRGRSYTIEGSADLGAWRPIPFRIVSPAGSTAVHQSYQSTDVRKIRAEVMPEEHVLRFFRLLVQ